MTETNSRPMVTQTAAELARAGIEEPIGTVLADGGYWNSQQRSAGSARDRSRC